MSEEKKNTKRPMRRRAVTSVASEGSSPMPDGPVPSSCGHHGCTGGGCNVRYVGPTSHVRDHHVLHAARGSTHIWGAAIITGLAVVLTGTIAFSSVQAREGQEVRRMEAKSRADVAKVVARLEMMEKALKELKTLCARIDAPKVAPAKESATTPTN